MGLGSWFSPKNGEGAMFKTIVIATDLSLASDRVIRCLPELRAWGVKEAVLVHAFGLRHLVDMEKGLAKMAEPKLAEQKATLQARGFRIDVEVAPRSPSLEVNRIAKERDASLIVVGSHGATLSSEVLLGGAALAILERAELPVLVLRVRVYDEEAQKRCEVACKDLTKHILFATDFSDNAERAFGYLEKVVEQGAKRVTLLHVQSKTRFRKHLEDRLEEFNKIDHARLERLKAELVRKGVGEVDIFIPYGFPIQEILRFADERDPSLIVMGSQGRGFISQIFLGSVSYNVVRNSPIPVLVVPPLR
jgi:nucleotide-binding universal stress UspA family protein